MGQPIGRLEKPNSSVAGGFGVEVGHPFSFGGIQILNASNETLTLDSVTPIDPSPGFQILGELARPADEEHTHLGGAGECPRPAELYATSCRGSSPCAVSRSTRSQHR